MLTTLLNRWGGSAEEIADKAQSLGLIRAAGIAARLLKEPRPTPRQMPPWLDDVLASVLSRVCFYEDERMPDPAECGALEACRAFLAGMPREAELEFQSLLVLLELSPFVFGPRRARFTELSPRDQDIHLQGWERSSMLPRKAGFKAIKSVAMMGYWSRPETFSSIGYSVAANPGVPEPQKGRWHSRETRST